MPIFRFRCGRWSRYAANSSGSGRTWSLCTRTHSQNGLPGVAFSRKFRPQSHRTKIYSTQRSPFYFLIFFFFLYHGPPLVPSVRPAPFSPRPIAVKLQLSNTRHSETSDCQSCLKCQDEWSFQRRVTTVVKRISTRRSKIVPFGIPFC